MRLIHKICAVAALAIAMTAPAAYAAGNGEAKSSKKAPHDAAWVQEKAKLCASCHGPNGVSQQPTFPTIAGQHQDYLVHSLKGYRDGSRKNGIMGSQAQGLSDAQIKALARFYANQESPLYTPALGK